MYEAIQSKDWEQGYNSEYRVSYLLESSSEKQQTPPSSLDSTGMR
jgi:hypothetical protein